MTRRLKPAVVNFAVRKMVATRHVLIRFWITWTRRVVSQVTFYLASIGLVLLLAVILFGMIKYYHSLPNGQLVTAVTGLTERFSNTTLVLVPATLLSLWILLGFVARQTLVVLIFAPGWGAKPLDYTIRLLAALPTVLLGNAVLVLTSTISLQPRSPLAIAAFILVTLALIGLPTVLQIGQEVLKDYDKAKVQQAVALGISRLVIGKKIVLPGIRRTFYASITVAVSRVIIEGYIVFDRSIFRSSGNGNSIRNAQDFAEVFYKLYSSMTISSNIVLILFLFIMAMIVNFWSFSAPVLTRGA